MLWLALPQPGQAPTPQRPSQIVHESTVPGETGQHAVIKMERVSTGGTRYVQQFRRQQADGPMTAAERAAKKRVRASLFPQNCASARTQDAARKRVAKQRTLDDAEREYEQGMQQHRLKLAKSCVDWMVQCLERAHALGVQQICGEKCMCSSEHPTVTCWECQTKREMDLLAESGYSLSWRVHSGTYSVL
jgi:hypothetical protein